MTDLIELLRSDSEGVAVHYSPASAIWMSQAADEIERLRTLTEWQPIETAPRGYTQIVIAMFEGDARVWAFVAYMNENDIWEDGEDVIANADDPTHWMPLPEPPTENGDD